MGFMIGAIVNKEEMAMYATAGNCPVTAHIVFTTSHGTRASKNTPYIAKNIKESRHIFLSINIFLPSFFYFYMIPLFLVSIMRSFIHNLWT